MSTEIIFLNKTDMPILVESWNIYVDGLYKFTSTLIEPDEEKKIINEINSYKITTYFTNIKHIKIWKNKNFDVGNIIGEIICPNEINMFTDLFNITFTDKFILQRGL